MSVPNPSQPETAQKCTSRVKRGMADMLKGGVIMDVVTPEQAKIAEDAGAVAVMALERVPADIRAQGVVAMTRHMEVDYKRPVPSSADGDPRLLRLEGRVVRSEGRKHWVEARVLDATGVELAAGKGLFIEIKPRLSGVMAASEAS